MAPSWPQGAISLLFVAQFLDETSTNAVEVVHDVFVDLFTLILGTMGTAVDISLPARNALRTVASHPDTNSDDRPH
jgi:hypothetical protein